MIPQRRLVRLGSQWSPFTQILWTPRDAFRYSPSMALHSCWNRPGLTALVPASRNLAPEIEGCQQLNDR